MRGKKLKRLSIQSPATLTRLFLISLFVGLLIGTEALAQVHFTFTPNTGEEATGAIPTSANPNIGGIPLASGDEIGVFTPAGLCVGAVVWTGSNTAITVWGDNTQTQAIDGIRAGEQMSYRVWRQSSNTEYTNVTVTYSLGNGIYAANGLYALSSLSASGSPTTPPSTPTLAAPPNGAVGVSTSTTLIWNPSSGAASYRLQVSTNSNFNSTVFDQSSIANTSQAVTGLANSMAYYWRVNATNASGTSPYSAVWSFITEAASPPPAPMLASPQNGATGISTNPTLNWNTASGAASYRLQVSTNSSFTTTVFDQSSITNTSQAVTGLVNNTPYYWRVNATNAAGTSPYSAVWSFATIVAPPSAPTLASPSDGATGISTSPTLRWNASDGATSYRLQVSTNPSFTTIAFDQSLITSTSQVVTGLTNSRLYYWRVNATNAAGTSPYSAVWSSTTGAGSSPAAPTLASPMDGATGIATSPTLRWNASSGAASYQLQVSTTPSFMTTVFDQSAITRTSQAIIGLVSNTTYYWRVNATNAGGTSPYSSVWSFTTGSTLGAPVAPTLESPSDGATVVLTSPVVSWNPSPGASSYQLQVSTSLSFSTLVIDQDGIGETFYTLDGLAPNTTYYWHVRATNATGTSEWSSLWGLKTLGVTGVNDWGGLPREVHVYQNYPNPFNNGTVIAFELPKTAFVSIEIYSGLGQKVVSLEQGTMQPGYHRVAWESILSSGVYYYRLVIDGRGMPAKKMIFLR